MKVGLCGLGKAGREFVKYVNSRDDVDLTVALCRNESKTAGKLLHEVTQFAGNKDLVIEKISECKFEDKPEVIIDFSACATTLKLVDLCVEKKINLVICPTDFTTEELEGIKNKANENGIGIMFAPTLTLGINVMMDYLEKISKVFPTFKFEIVEKHPSNKPSPTRTARYMADVIDREEVPISSVRLDGYVGVHETICADGLERITLTHETCSREAFARGAIFAAEYIKDKQGFYTINKVLREKLVEGEAFYDED